MLKELKSKNYRRVKHFFQPLSYNLVIDSIIERYTNALVFADDMEKPGNAIIWNKQDTILIGGKPKDQNLIEAFCLIIKNIILPEARKKYIPELVLHYYPNLWAEKLVDNLASLLPQKAYRKYYQFKRNSLKTIDAQDESILVGKIDMEILEQDILNIEHLKGWILSYWQSKDDFLKNGFGWYLLKDGLMASWCLTVYRSLSEYEFGVATVPEFRKQDFASIVTSNCLKHCLDRKLKPHWHCWNKNIASNKIALRTGFSDPVTYEVLKLKI